MMSSNEHRLNRLRLSHPQSPLATTKSSDAYRQMANAYVNISDLTDVTPNLNHALAGTCFDLL